MSFKLASSPHQHNQRNTSQIMRMVTIACLPGITIQAVMFGYGVLIQLILAIVTAWASEALVLKLRNKAVLVRLKDNSALLTAVLLAIAIPPLCALVVNRDRHRLCHNNGKAVVWRPW